MEEQPKIPTSLRIVAVLFILGGACAVLEILISLANRRISFNFGVLGLFIGPGLLALRPGWRTCALVFTWLSLIFLPIFCLIALGYRGPVDFIVFGQKMGYVPKELAFLFAAALFLYSVWQYRVLTRPAVRKLFGLTPD